MKHAIMILSILTPKDNNKNVTLNLNGTQHYDMTLGIMTRTIIILNILTLGITIKK
jgi:hypothetical protein